MNLSLSVIWDRVTGLVALSATHAIQGQCIRIKPNTVPIRMCVKNAVEGSLCCSQHKEECPVPNGVKR